MNRNKPLYVAQNTIYCLSVLLIGGSVIQSFLLEHGVPETQVSLYMAVIQVIQSASMLLMSLVVDRIRNPLRTYGLFCMSILPFFGMLTFFCFPTLPPDLIFWAVLLVGGLTTALMTVPGLLSYKIPYHIMPIEEYGRASGWSGIVYGLAGAALSSLMALCIGWFSYRSAMAAFFLLGALLAVGAWLLARQFRPIPFQEKEKPAANASIFRYRPFYILLIPNLLRGFCSGTFFLSMTFGHLMGVTDESSGAVLTFLLLGGTLLGCLLFSRLASYKSAGRFVLGGCLMMLLSLPLLGLAENSLTFYCVYLVASFSITLVDYSVPYAVTRVVDYARIGQFTSWRMTLTTLGTALGNALGLPLAQTLGVFGVLLLSTSMQIISGLVYFFFLKKAKDTPQN